MAYTTQAACENAAGGALVLIDLCDLDGNAPGVVNAAVLAQAIADTDGWIDSFVAKQRAVPLNPVPVAIARLSAQETVYRLRSNKPRAPIGDVEQRRHEENLDWLKRVARGEYTLGVDPQPVKSALVSPAVVTVDDDTTESTATNLRGLW
jgi:phage gp36-like protein